jgi:hypothetical protein
MAGGVRRRDSCELRRQAMAVYELQRPVMVAGHGGLRAKRDRMNQSRWSAWLVGAIHAPVVHGLLSVHVQASGGETTRHEVTGRDENGTDIFRPYSRPNLFRGF